MRIVGLAFAAALAAFALASGGAAASATSIAAAPKHRPESACDGIGKVLAAIKAGDLDELEDFPGPTFYTDALGEVEVQEEEAFVAAMLESEGRKDRRPMRIGGLYTVRKDDYRPTYLLVLERERWRKTRLETDGMLELVEVDDPHWAVERSEWLVTFRSDRVDDVREVPELYEFAEEERQVAGCGGD